ncbi:uncharacterized protein [Asterias amurensis]|uniref:uncharacterized protein n=1 Tax=Asterias amurensis TaxID=7602 RepID=UPI003AB2D193
MDRVLLFTALALAIVCQVYGKLNLKPEETIDVTSEHCGFVKEFRQVLSDNPSLKKRSPRNYWCSSTLERRKEALCSCPWHTLRDDDFMEEKKDATNFLERGVEKRSLHEECCNEGCYYEEVYEVC